MNSDNHMESYFTLTKRKDISNKRISTPKYNCIKNVVRKCLIHKEVSYKFN